eukprot:m.326441 g.326441  ORF g.326441 m.326441 type:complete len:52 (+) comp16558_c1_seq10:3892-4047(+)
MGLQSLLIPRKYLLRFNKGSTTTTKQRQHDNDKRLLYVLINCNLVRVLQLQ